MSAYRQIWLLWYHTYFLAAVWTSSSWPQEILEGNEEAYPYFGQPIGNVTVPLGKEAILSCTVRNLGIYKVGWLKAEDQTVLSLDNRVVTHNPRISITQDEDRDTWRLHIRQLKHSDRGCYMCQINTASMKKQIGCLDVHVPPDILDVGTSSDMRVDEGRNVTLTCLAQGHPPPRVTWRREDAKPITLYTHNSGFITVESFVGHRMELVGVDYTQMGAYLCIASNDIPPAVSKRIVLQIDFAPVSREPTQRIGALLGSTVSLQCDFFAFPSENTSWHREIGEIHEYGGEYKVEVTRYTYHISMQLTVKNLRALDFGRYYCSVSNSKGTARSTIQLFEVRPETTTSPSTTPTTTVAPTTREIVRPTLPFTTLEESVNENSVEELIYYNEVEGGSGAEARSRSYIVSTCGRRLPTGLPLLAFSLGLVWR